MRKINSFVIALLLISAFTACSTAPKENLAAVDTTNLKQLEKVQVSYAPPATSSSPQTNPGELRLKSLRDSAMTIGAQGGLSWASTAINKKMSEDSKYLDSIFNFNALMLRHGVLPPVLEQGDNTLNLDDPNTIRISDRTYKIVQQARFATTAPNWREYLWLNYPKPELPDKTLLPRNAEESKVWKKGVADGWENGIKQAYNIFQQNLARLKRDFNGMLLYRKLLEEKMISPPFVSHTDLGVTGDGDNMRVNDQVLRIVELPKLQSNSNHWHAIVVPQGNRHD